MRISIWLTALAAMACTPAGSDSTDDRPDFTPRTGRDSTVPPLDDGVADDAAPDAATGDAKVADPDGRVVDPDGGPLPDLGPDMAVTECVADPDCDDDNPCTTDTCAGDVCDRAPIEGCCVRDADCGDGACLRALRECAAPTPPGVVVITEFLPDPDAVDDAAGEWVEITNTSGTDVVLNGWALRGDENEVHRFDFAERTVLPAGGVWLLAREADPAVNGGVDPDYVYDDVTLSNNADRVALTDALGNLVDEVVYDAEFPLGSGVSTSLSPLARSVEANDDPLSWCASVAPWGDGTDLGSPGALNPACPDRHVDWCRIQFPHDTELESGDRRTAYVRVFEEGITDRSDATDPDEALVVQLGLGAEESHPADADWAWTDAVPNVAWDAVEGEEPGNDEYQADLVAGVPGIYDFAFRVQRDGGAWLYCDRPAGAGSDGAEDGYQVENAGALTVVPGPPTPDVGEVVVNELQFDVRDPLAESDGEWIELFNRSPERRRLEGCVLADGAGEAQIRGVTLPPLGHALFARDLDPGVNGGLAADGTFGFSLNNNDGDVVTLRCGEVEVDRYVYDGSLGGDGVAIQRDAEGTWCVADAVYFADEGDPESEHLGTPGGENRACPPPSLVDFCALQSPLDAEGREGERLALFGVVYEEGLTDASPLNDPSERLEGQAGVGPDGSDPAVDEGWSWVDGGPNPEWDGAAVGQPNNDEYLATVILPAEGAYDMAWRFRLDGGAWTYCDRDPGSDDGYGPEDAGQLTATPPPPPPPAGAVLFTEVMYDPHDALAEADAEWVELTNVSDAEYSLGGCFFQDAGGGSIALDPLTLAPGEAAVLARSADPLENGGLEPAQVFGFGLGNDGDLLTLRCGEVEVARLAYDVGGEWPEAQRFSISLEPGADPALAESWCRVRPMYFDGHHGTPGEANPPCTEALGSCRFQHPLDAARAPGIDVVAYGRVFHAGVTDRTPQVDVDALLQVDAGWGPPGTVPGSEGWTWAAAEPNDGWDGEAAGFANDDEYRRTLRFDVEVTFDLAYRASADDGRTWTVCDGAGHLEVRAPIDPCDELACDTPPETECLDDATVRFHEAPGACVVDGDEAACAYPTRDVDCGPEICFAGRCAPEGAQDNPQAPGEVRITEVMFDPADPLVDETAEFVELRNDTDRVVDLVGCALDTGRAPAVLGTLRLDPGGYAVLARSADDGLNGGVAPDQLFDFPLANNGGALTLRCGAVDIDSVEWDASAAPGQGLGGAGRGHSLSLDADDAWCRGRTPYSVGNWGTPGAANPACDVPVGWCVLQSPHAVDAQVDAEVTVYGRFYAEGLTDLTPGNDPHPLAYGELGYGEHDTDPDDSWTWLRAEYNPGWNGGDFGEPNNDELQATLVVPLPRESGFDFAYRVTVDDGRTWTLCDADGSVENGYTRDQAGRLDPTPAPCRPNPCVEPPPRACVDADTLRIPGALGACEAVDGAGVCTYDAVEVACACADDACADLPPAPAAPGDALVTEIMYDPHHALEDATAEWIELTAPDGAYSLAGCRLSDRNENGALLGDIRVGPDVYALLARVADPARNGGLAPDGLFGFALGNSGDSVQLECGGVVIDAVAYDDGPAFPDARAASLSLDPGAFHPVVNDDGAAWCLGVAPYFEVGEPNRGTPGAANPVCPVPDP